MINYVRSVVAGKGNCVRGTSGLEVENRLWGIDPGRWKFTVRGYLAGFSVLQRRE
jgi:hypothetical protein